MDVIFVSLSMFALYLCGMVILAIVGFLLALIYMALTNNK